MILELKAEKRDIFGKKLISFRNEGKLPVVLYGRGIESMPFFVDSSQFKKIWKEAGESTIIELKDESNKPLSVIIYDVDIDPVSNEPRHADFYKVEMDKPITAVVPFVFEGVSPAEKELGGMLVKVMREVEIEALPKDLPHEIKIDLSALKAFGDRITLGDIRLPSGVKFTAKPEEVVALIEEMKEEEIEEKGVEIEDIEVEKKGKKEEEGAEAGEEKEQKE